MGKGEDTPAVQGGGELGEAMTDRLLPSAQWQPSPGPQNNRTEASIPFSLYYSKHLWSPSFSRFLKFGSLTFLTWFGGHPLGVPPWTFWASPDSSCCLPTALSTAWVRATAYSCVGCTLIGCLLKDMNGAQVLAHLHSAKHATSGAGGTFMSFYPWKPWGDTFSWFTQRYLPYVLVEAGAGHLVDA